MWQTYKFGMHWRHDGKMYYDEVPAASMVEATDYFIDNKRDDVTLVRVEEVGPDDETAVRDPAFSPVKPFSPLVARRRLDKDEDAR
jgi:hypothetical protein